MNIFQHFGGKIPTYQEFVNSKKMLHAMRELVYASMMQGRGCIVAIHPNRVNYYQSFEFALFDPHEKSGRLFLAMSGIS
jgi:hypothetical protein